MSANTVASSKKRSTFKTLMHNKALFLMVLPGAIYLLINNYVPMAGLIIAFKRLNMTSGIWNSPWIGFDNFQFLFQTTDAFVITRNTVLYNLVFIVTGLIFSVAFAATLNEVRNRTQARIFQSVMLFPYFLSYVVVSYIVFAILNTSDGLFNHIIGAFGVDPINFYASPQYWPYIFPLINIWKNTGTDTIVFLAAMMGIDHTYYEATLVDGATKWKQFTNVTLPAVMPMIMILFLLKIGRIFNTDPGMFYQVPFNAGLLFSTISTVDTYVLNAILTGNNSMAAAAGLYQSVVGFIVIIAANSIVRRINSENSLF